MAGGLSSLVRVEKVGGMEKQEEVLEGKPPESEAGEEEEDEESTRGEAIAEAALKKLLISCKRIESLLFFEERESPISFLCLCVCVVIGGCACECGCA